MAKIEVGLRKLLYFVNILWTYIHHFRYSKCAQIALSKIIFYGKNHVNLSQIDFHIKISYGEQLIQINLC